MIMAVSWQAAAQRPLIMSGSAGFMFEPPPTQDSVRLYSSQMYGQRVRNYFYGNAYRPGREVTV